MSGVFADGAIERLASKAGRIAPAANGARLRASDIDRWTGPRLIWPLYTGMGDE